MSAAKSAAHKAFKYLRESPRITKFDLKDNPGAFTKARMVKSNHNKAGQCHRELQTAGKPPLGWIYGDWYRSWFQIWPSDKTYNKDIHLRREYPPLSLLELQRLIDLGYIDVTQPIDLTTLCNTKQYFCDPMQRQFGVQLTEEGADIFAAKISIEVQWASEPAIAAVERNGGQIVAAYYDPISLDALVDPMRFFQRGDPIPKRGFPPIEIIQRYIDPKLRGYLANPKTIEHARLELAQKYGYPLPDLKTDDPQLYENLFKLKKDPLQVFYGLEPGWVVNTHDQCVLKPVDEKLKEYYNT